MGLFRLRVHLGGKIEEQGQTKKAGGCHPSENPQNVWQVGYGFRLEGIGTRVHGMDKYNWVIVTV